MKLNAGSVLYPVSVTHVVNLSTKCSTTLRQIAARGLACVSSVLSLVLGLQSLELVSVRNTLRTRKLVSGLKREVKMVTISDAGKVLTEIDNEVKKLNDESLSLTSQVNSILQTAFEAVKKIGHQQEAIIQRCIALEQTALTTIMSTLEK